MMQEPTTTYLTPEGKLKLEAELEDLKTNKRRELAERLNFAIKQGDLSENADYITAKEDQAFLEGRIRTIEGDAAPRDHHRGTERRRSAHRLAHQGARGRH